MLMIDFADNKENLVPTDSCKEGGGDNDVLMTQVDEQPSPTLRAEAKRATRVPTALEKATRAPTRGVGKAPHRVVDAGPRPVPDPEVREKATKSNSDNVSTSSRGHPGPFQGLRKMSDEQFHHVFQNDLPYSQGGAPIARHMPQYVAMPETMIPTRIARQTPRPNAEEITGNIQREFRNITQAQMQKPQRGPLMYTPVQVSGKIEKYQDQKLIDIQDGPQFLGSTPVSRVPTPAPGAPPGPNNFYTVRKYVDECLHEERQLCAVPLSIDQVANLHNQLLEVARKFMLDVELDTSPALRELFDKGLDSEYNLLSRSLKRSLHEEIKVVGARIVDGYQAENAMKAAAQKGPAVSLFQGSPPRAGRAEPFNDMRTARPERRASMFPAVPSQPAMQGRRQSLGPQGPAPQAHRVPSPFAPQQNRQDTNMS